MSNLPRAVQLTPHRTGSTTFGHFVPIFQAMVPLKHASGMPQMKG